MLLLRSDGCANAVKRILGKIDGVESVDTNVEAKTVVVQADASVTPQFMLEKLLKVRVGTGWRETNKIQYLDVNFSAELTFRATCSLLMLTIVVGSIREICGSGIVRNETQRLTETTSLG